MTLSLKRIWKEGAVVPILVAYRTLYVAALHEFMK